MNTCSTVVVLVPLFYFFSLINFKFSAHFKRPANIISADLVKPSSGLKLCWSSIYFSKNGMFIDSTIGTILRVRVEYQNVINTDLLFIAVTFLVLWPLPVVSSTNSISPPLNFLFSLSEVSISISPSRRIMYCL